MLSLLTSTAVLSLPRWRPLDMLCWDSGGLQAAIDVQCTGSSWTVCASQLTVLRCPAATCRCSQAGRGWTSLTLQGFQVSGLGHFDSIQDLSRSTTTCLTPQGCKPT